MTTIAPHAPRTNRYAGTCFHCDTRVQAEAGHLWHGYGKWNVSHVIGQCPPATPALAQLAEILGEAPVEVEDDQWAYDMELAEDDDAEVKVQSATGQTYTGSILPGIYTLADEDGGHTTYRIQVQRTDAKFAPGEVVIGYLSGSDNESDYTSFGFIKPTGLVLWKRFRDSGGFARIEAGARAIIADPSIAEVARTCIRCNALLTTPESIARGLGKVCHDKGW